MDHDLFVSYSRVDSAFVLRLVRDLRSRGIEPWLDQLDIPAGANWDDEIEKALDQAKTVIVILSDVSGKSENVKNEIGAALERDKLVVPVVLGKGAVPLMINRLQREDFSGEYEAALDHLVRRLSGGSRTQSLRAMSTKHVERIAKEASARLSANKSSSKEPLDSLSPVSDERISIPGASRRPRQALVWGGGLAVLAAGVALAVSVFRAPSDLQPPSPASQAEAGGTAVAPAPAPAPQIDPVPKPDPVVPRPDPAPQPAPVPPNPPPLANRGALLCRDQHFGGLCETIVKSPSLASSKVGNDKVSSLRLGTCSVVRVCSNFDFQGACVLITDDQRDLSATRLGDDDMTSVECFEGDVDIASIKRGAELCPKPGFGGVCHSIIRSQSLADTKLGDDKASSLRLVGCRAVKLCTDNGFGGTCEVFSTDQPDLSATRVGDKRASSIECIYDAAEAAAAIAAAPDAP